MLIYLDLNVIQDLKKEDGDQFLEMIKADQKRNVYCFSEAHLHDLSRDLTVAKFADMDLLQQVVGKNCFSFNREVNFNYETPREYYDRFEWSPIIGSLEELSSDFNIILEVYKLVPLNFRDALTDTELPADMPDQYRNMLEQTVSFYDFFTAFYDFTKELNERQKSFKALLQYLRKQNLIKIPFESFGIIGFDGTNIIDQKEFLDTYSVFCLKDMPNANIYEGFVRMYYCLEYLGIVQGKASKQKMLNLANDGRHAFFGGYCDMVVSKDDDFINKAKFIYNCFGIFPYVISLNEYKEWLIAGPRQDDSIDGMMNEVLNIKSLDCIHRKETENTIYTSYSLSQIYYEYFNVLTVGNVSGEYFFYFSSEKLRFSKGTLVEQIKLLADLLLNDLGIDLQNKGSYFSEEMSEKGWPGRAWIYGDYAVELLLNDGLHLTFNAVA